MPRIGELTLVQVNRRFDDLDTVQNTLNTLLNKVNEIGQTASIADPAHAPSTTNNLTFNWNPDQSLSWQTGFIKGKNWSAQTLATPAVKSSSKGQLHIWGVVAGSLSGLQPQKPYWIGWDFVHQQMLASQDAAELHGNYNVHIVCQLWTGTTTVSPLQAGGGGIYGGTDLSGLSYNLLQP